jgi:hypothetical protein
VPNRLTTTIYDDVEELGVAIDDLGF